MRKAKEMRRKEQEKRGKAKGKQKGNGEQLDDCFIVKLLDGMSILVFPSLTIESGYSEKLTFGSNKNPQEHSIQWIIDFMGMVVYAISVGIVVRRLDGEHELIIKVWESLPEEEVDKEVDKAAIQSQPQAGSHPKRRAKTSKSQQKNQDLSLDARDLGFEPFENYKGIPSIPKAIPRVTSRRHRVIKNHQKPLKPLDNKNYNIDIEIFDKDGQPIDSVDREFHKFFKCPPKGQEEDLTFDMEQLRQRAESTYPVVDYPSRT